MRAARVWAYPPQDGRDQAAQFRFTTGADVLVSGTLTRVTGQLLELAVAVTPATGAVHHFTVTGPKPGLLAKDAVARIRNLAELRENLVERLERELAITGAPELLALIEEVRAYPAAPRSRTEGARPAPIARSVASVTLHGTSGLSW